MVYSFKKLEGNIHQEVLFASLSFKDWQAKACLQAERKEPVERKQIKCR